MIKQEHGRRSVRAMCEAFGVAPSAYYAWHGRPESVKERADRALLVEIRAVHRESRETYGAVK